MTTSNMSVLMDARTTAAHLDVSERTLEGWRARGTGPRFIRLSSTKGVRYREQDIVAWMRTREDVR
ncbi:helix-turn-helix domain-containing protein [Microbacterium oleivorans]|uniref:helix-turn-helix transcriptional regulator n=1 Tax=Microbacterium TaxID=33882 RepID=UPI0033DFBC93